MKIEKDKDGTRLVVRLIGRLDTTTAPELQKVVGNELQDILELQIDMEELEYVSSAGLRVLLSATKKIKAAGGSMLVKNVNPQVMDVFKITGFNAILTIV